MKKLVLALVLAVLVLSAFSSVAYAEKPDYPGVWRTHNALLGGGVVESGAEWGALVSMIAQSAPGAIPNAHGRGPGK